MKKYLLAFFLITLLCAGSVYSIQLIRKDNQGHYHFRCDAAVGGKVIVALQGASIVVKGGPYMRIVPLEKDVRIDPRKRKLAAYDMAKIFCEEFGQ